MIEIDLLPQEVRSKNTKITFRQEYFLYLFVFLLGCLILAHLCLGVLNITSQVKLSGLENKWEQLTPQKKMVESFESGAELSSATSSAVQKLFDQRVCWSRKLNELSFNLPDGVWFNEILFNQTTLIIRGSIISLRKEEMVLINTFLNRLKQNRDFSSDFSSLELSLLERKNIGGYEVINFTLTGTLK
jgi:Tfp pilus assembly protein PilN